MKIECSFRFDSDDSLNFTRHGHILAFITRREVTYAVIAYGCTLCEIRLTNIQLGER